VVEWYREARGPRQRAVIDDVRDAPTREVRERRTRAEERLGGKSKVEGGEITAVR
jgi:hypothetical protein